MLGPLRARGKLCMSQARSTCGLERATRERGGIRYRQYGRRGTICFFSTGMFCMRFGIGDFQGKNLVGASGRAIGDPG